MRHVRIGRRDGNIRQFVFRNVTRKRGNSLKEKDMETEAKLEIEYEYAPLNYLSYNFKMVLYSEMLFFF